jgi:hypothetical protein
MGTPGRAPPPARAHAHEPMQIVATVRATVWPASVECAEHPLLLASEDSHLCVPQSRSRILLDRSPWSRPCPSFQPHYHPALRPPNGRNPSSAQTYKSRFTQKVNLNSAGGRACKKSTNPDRTGEGRRWATTRPDSATPSLKSCSALHPPGELRDRSGDPGRAGDMHRRGAGTESRKVRPAGIEPAACGLKDRCSLAPRREPLTTELRARAGGVYWLKLLARPYLSMPGPSASESADDGASLTEAPRRRARQAAR